MTPPRLKDQVAADIKTKTTARTAPGHWPGSGSRGPAGGAPATGVDGQYQRPERYDPSAAFSFEQLMPVLMDFRAAVDEAIARDRHEYMLLIAASSAVMPLTGPILQVIRLRHEALATQAHLAQFRFERAMMALGRFATIPPRLQAQAAHWDALAGRLTERANEVKQWATIPGWSGTSADEYRSAALTQAHALAELAGIFSGAGKSAQSAAALNMAAFSNVARATTMYARLVRIAPPLTRSFQFIRTRVAKQRTDEVSQELERLVELNETRAAPLTSQIAVTVATPALLEMGSWPNGTSGASVTPMDTSRAIKPEQFYSYIT